MYDYQLTNAGLPSTGHLNGVVLLNKWDRVEYLRRLNEEQTVVFLELIQEAAREEAEDQFEQELQERSDYPYGVSDIKYFSNSIDAKQPSDGYVYGLALDKGYRTIARAIAPVEACLEYPDPADLEWEFIEPTPWGWSGISPRSSLEEMMDRYYPFSHPHLENLRDWNPNWNAGMGTNPILCSRLARIYTYLLSKKVEEIYTVNYILRLSPSFSTWTSYSIHGIAWVENGVFSYRGYEDFDVPANSGVARNAAKYCRLVEGVE